MLGGTFLGLDVSCTGVGCGEGCGNIRRGDANADGVMNNFDIDAWTLGVTDPERYIAVYCFGGSNCRICRLDMNRDGMINSFDIDPLVECLVYGQCP